MSIDSMNILRWELHDNISGEFPVSLIATDGIEDVPQNFILRVNSIPIVTSMDSISVRMGDTLRYHLKSDGLNPIDSISYFIDLMRPGMNLDNNSGLLTWIPSKSDIGQHHFNLEVNDGQSKTGTNQNIQIFVYELPVFTGALSTEAFVGLEYSTFLTAEDMFGDKLNEPGAIIIENTTIKDYLLSEPYGRYFRWTPGELDVGKYEIHIRITDEYGFTKHHFHSLSVFNNPCFQCEGDPRGSPADTTRN